MQQAYIVDAIRTPIGRYAGALSSVRADDLAAIPLRALAKRNADLDLAALDEVWLGCANQAGEDNRNVARMAVLLAAYPVSVGGATVNRLCGSGIEAVSSAARAIRAGEIDLAVAGGVESMSRAPLVIGKSGTAFGRNQAMHDTTLGWRFINPDMQRRFGTDSMPETAENLALEKSISRADQDHFALASQHKARVAMEQGYLKTEIVPVQVYDARGVESSIERDEHPRDTNIEALGKLRPIVRDDGSVTAGNSSGVNDGACAILLASEAALKTHNLVPLARVAGSCSVGVPPRIMGIGPAPASEKLLKRQGVRFDELDIIELNEAFAAQVLAVLRALGIADDDPRVNPWGGAIALGHPLGASGARLVTTATRQLLYAESRYALCSMCVGVGQGIAILLERA